MLTGTLLVCEKKKIFIIRRQNELEESAAGLEFHQPGEVILNLPLGFAGAALSTGGLLSIDPAQANHLFPTSCGLLTTRLPS